MLQANSFCLATNADKEIKTEAKSLQKFSTKNKTIIVLDDKQKTKSGVQTHPRKKQLARCLYVIIPFRLETSCDKAIDLFH